MPSELQQNRYDQLIRRVGGIVGPGSKVSEALTELFPVIDVERVPGELLLLGGTRLAFGGGTIVGAAGQRPKAQLFNPVGSGQLITVTSVIASTQVADTLRWGVQPIQLSTGIGTETFRDTRLGLARPTGAIFQESAVALASGTNQARLIVNDPIHLDDENAIAILAPGNGFEIGLSLVANSLFYTFSWRERTAERSELSF